MDAPIALRWRLDADYIDTILPWESNIGKILTSFGRLRNDKKTNCPYFFLKPCAFIKVGLIYVYESAFINIKSVPKK